MVEQTSQFETESLASIMRDQAIARPFGPSSTVNETQPLREAAANAREGSEVAEFQAAFNGATVGAIERIVQDLRGLDSRFAGVEGRISLAAQQRALSDHVTADLDRKLAELEAKIATTTDAGVVLAAKFERELSNLSATSRENELFIEDVSHRTESSASAISELETRHAGELKSLRDQINAEIESTRAGLAAAAETARRDAEKSDRQAVQLLDELKAIRDQLLNEIVSVRAAVSSAVDTGNALEVKWGQELVEVRAQAEETRLLTEEVSHKAESTASTVSSIESRHASDAQSLHDQLLVEVAAARQAISVELGELQHRMEKQQESLATALHESAKAAGGVSGQTAGQVAALADDLEQVRIRLLRAERALRSGGMRPAKPNVPSVVLPDRGVAPLDLPGFDYLMFEKQFRGPRDDLKIKQSRYIDLYRACRNVVDLGCGRGEFLELMAQNNLVATGVDNNQEMVDLCAERGLTVMSANIFDYLLSVPDGSVDGFFCAQVVEHLPPEKIQELMHLCFLKAQRGAVLVCETVNPLCLYALSEFWLDPTHVRPVPANLLRFMAEQAKFQVRTLLFSAPMPKESVSPQLEVVGPIPDEARAYRDYAIIARRG